MKKLILDFFSWLLMKRKGWKLENQLPPELKKYVLLSAPHTSNWDAVYGILFFHQIGLPVKFAIKKEWLKFPFKKLLQAVGAIAIDRGNGNRTTVVDALIRLFKENEELIICITPEGTRKRVTKWKTGFYYVAAGAKVPIAVGHLDYKNKKGIIYGKLIVPSGNMQKDMYEIMQLYAAAHAKFPEKFALDERYSSLPV
jgi:1-acyl-sn-glycerol-3-phosphate acyltransferase